MKCHRPQRRRTRFLGSDHRRHPSGPNHGTHRRDLPDRGGPCRRDTPGRTPPPRQDRGHSLTLRRDPAISATTAREPASGQLDSGEAATETPVWPGESTTGHRRCESEVKPFQGLRRLGFWAQSYLVVSEMMPRFWTSSLSKLGFTMWGMYRCRSQISGRISVTSTPAEYTRTTELSDTTMAMAPVELEIDAAAMCRLPSPRGCLWWGRVASKWRHAD